MLSNINVGIPVMDATLQYHNPILFQPKKSQRAKEENDKSKSLSEALKYKYHYLQNLQDQQQQIYNIDKKQEEEDKKFQEQQAVR